MHAPSLIKIIICSFYIALYLAKAMGNPSIIAICVYCQVLIYGWVNQGTIAITHRPYRRVFDQANDFSATLECTMLWLRFWQVNHSANAKMTKNILKSLHVSDDTPPQLTSSSPSAQSSVPSQTRRTSRHRPSVQGNSLGPQVRGSRGRQVSQWVTRDYHNRS